MKELDRDFLNWIMEGRPPISEESMDAYEKFWGQPYDDERTPLEVSDDELWEASGHKGRMYLEKLETKSESKTAKELEDGEYDVGREEEAYNRLVEKYEHDWQRETGERLREPVNDETEHKMEVEDY